MSISFFALLISIDLSNVTTIENYAFNGFSHLREISLPSSLTKIGESSFRNCRNLLSVTIPSSVSVIGDYAFRYCNSLTIYAEIDSQPKFWYKKWNDSERPVYYGVNESNYIVNDVFNINISIIS